MSMERKVRERITNANLVRISGNLKLQKIIKVVQ